MLEETVITQKNTVFSVVRRYSSEIADVSEQHTGSFYEVEVYAK
jgi:hypothetical protein